MNAKIVLCIVVLFIVSRGSLNMNANQESNQAKVNDLLEIFNRQITQKINNESIDIDKYAVVDKMLEFDTVQFFLFDIICNLILENLSFFTKGQEQDDIDEIIREKIISDWENGSASAHLKEIQQSILDDERNQELLKLYVKILKIQERGGITIDDNQDRRKLLEVGIIREEKDGRVKVANPIYESVFNREWAYQNLPTLPQVTSNQKVNNKDRATKQSRLFSQIILFAFLIIAVVYPISRPRNESSPQSSPSGTTSQQSTPIEPTTSPKNIGEIPSECMNRKDKNDNTPQNTDALAQDAMAAGRKYMSENPLEFKNLYSNQVRFYQTYCTVVVRTFFDEDQTFEKKHEELLRAVIKGAVNPDAKNCLGVVFIVGKEKLKDKDVDKFPTCK